MLFRCKFKQLAFVFSLCMHWEMRNLSRITMESFGAFFLLLFKTSIIFSFPASHQMLAYLTRLLQGTVQKLEQDFNILKQSIMSLISYWRTKEIRWSKPQHSRGCVTDLAPPLSSPVSPSPQAWSTDLCQIHWLWQCNAVATSALLLEDLTMKHALALLRAMTS